MKKSDDRPLIALTMGDVAGVGPEVIARAWGEFHLRALARPLVVGDRALMERAVRTMGVDAEVRVITRPEESAPAARVIPLLEVDTADLSDVKPAAIDPRAGRAAHDFLIAATDLALAGRVDAVTTLPLNKEALHAGGIDKPGHTEILAERCGVIDHAMMLYLPPTPGGDPEAGGFGVVHVTLHVSLRSALDLIDEASVYSKILLADRALRPLTGGRPPRVAVAALNPHAGEGGLFGDEESRIIAPAVARAAAAGVRVSGPIAADTLFSRALRGEFDAVVAMYHDQGHVALKTIGFDRAVNVTLGLPIVRTSVAHGTAYDIAWQGKAETASLIQAVGVAARMVMYRRKSAGVVSGG